MTDFPFTARLRAAIDLAARVHEPQYRKEPDLRTPYVAHAYGVGIILSQYGFSEDVVIAGLLHDVIEDQPQYRREVEAFGANVLDWIEWVSERKFDASGNRLPWAARKQAYNERMRTAPPEARAVSAADKIHNMQSTLLVLQRGLDAWGQLSGSRTEHLARYRALLLILREGWMHPLLAQYESVLVALERT